MKKTVFIFSLLFLVAVSCDSLKTKKEDKINKITYSIFSGDKGGNFFNLEITKDSVFYEAGNRFSKKNNKDKISNEDWKNLCKIDLDKFDQIESTKSRKPHDGKDEIISITTKTKVHSCLNGKIVNSTEIKDFIALLNNIKSRIAL